MLEGFLDYLALDLSQWEVYGLFFLLGSFAVATLSDVKHMSAQREFMDVWWIVALVLLGVQLWRAQFAPDAPLIVKWVLVGLFGLLSHRAIGLWLRLATADVAACVAAAMLLSPGLVLAFFLLLKLLSWPMSKLLARGKPAYPFMPVITLATIAILAIGFLGGIVGP
jgi:hypothetical protein